MSDSSGFIYCPDGFTEEQVDWIKELKEVRRGRIHEAAKEFNNISFHEGERPWKVEGDCIIPSATQNEVSGKDAEILIRNGATYVAEAANMPVSRWRSMHL